MHTKHIRPLPLNRRQALIFAIPCLVIWIVVSSQMIPGARRGDFLNLYTGASLALDGHWRSMYTEAGQLVRERTFVPDRRKLTPFVRPPAYAVVMAPLALIPFPVAFWAWIGTQTAVLLGCWAWAWRRFGPEALVWAVLMILPTTGIAHGQDCVLYLAILIVAFALGDRKKFFLSGLVLGLGMVKFHLFLLWPLVLIVQKRWRMLLGLTVCCLAQVVLSLAVAGWSGLVQYVNFVLHLGRYYSPERYLNVAAILLNLRLSYLPYEALLTIFVVGMVLWAAHRIGPLWLMFALATAGSLSVGPHVYTYDGSMLLLPAWCVIFLSGWPVSRLAAAVLCSPLTLVAAAMDTPYVCFTPLVVLVFVIALCVESRLSDTTRMAEPARDVEDGLP
jgi:Glycosyltransferase family 87